MTAGARATGSFWDRPTAEIIASLEAEIEASARRCELSSAEVAAVLALDDGLRALGVGVGTEAFSRLAERARAAARRGGGRHG